MKRSTQEKLAAATKKSAAPIAPSPAPVAAPVQPPATPPPLPAVAPVAAPPAAVPAVTPPAPVAAPKDTRIIVVLAAANPRRAGTLAAKTFACYRTGQTVAEWREAVKAADADPGYLAPDAKKGLIAVVPAGTDVQAFLAARKPATPAA